MSKANSKKFVVTYPDGREEAIVGLKGFCSENGLDPGTMYAVASGKYKQHHGFKCRYAED